MTDWPKDPALNYTYDAQHHSLWIASKVCRECGGWQAVLVEDGEDAGEYVGIEQPRRPQIISRRVVQTAVTALQRYRRLSPQELTSLSLSSVGDVVSDEYLLASDWLRDDYGFVIEQGAGYRRTIRSVADCVMTHLWSPVAALAWSNGLHGMGALGAAVDRVRNLETLVRED